MSKQATHESTNEFRLNRQTYPGMQSVPLSVILRFISLLFPRRLSSGFDGRYAPHTVYYNQDNTPSGTNFRDEFLRNQRGPGTYKQRK